MVEMKRVVTAVVLVFAWAVLAPAEEFTFQQGVNHGLGVYEGGQDRTINDSSVVACPQSELRIRSLYPSAKEVYNTLIRFDGLAEMLPNAKIQSAELVLTYGEHDLQDSVPAVIEVYTVGKMWHDPNATWTLANGGLPWETSGAQGVTDRLAMHKDPVDMGPRSWPDYYLEGREFTFPLDETEVQSWFDNPDSNPGIILVMDAVSRTSVIFHSNNSEDPADHPRLRITAISCPSIPGDVTSDCYVNWSDFRELMNNWLVEGSIAADITGDEIVNLEDYTVLTRNWLQCSHPDDPSCNWVGP